MLKNPFLLIDRKTHYKIQDQLLVRQLQSDLRRKRKNKMSLIILQRVIPSGTVGGNSVRGVKSSSTHLITSLWPFRAARCKNVVRSLSTESSGQLGKRLAHKFVASNNSTTYK